MREVLEAPSISLLLFFEKTSRGLFRGALNLADFIFSGLDCFCLSEYNEKLCRLNLQSCFRLRIRFFAA